MKTPMLKVALAAGMLAAPLLAPAADLDLYANPPLQQNTINTPNVLFVVDNTANWSQMFTAEKGALVSVFNSLPNDKFKIGVMLGTETGNGNGNTGGGYLRAAIRPMTATNKAKYAAMINSFDDTNDKGSGGLSGVQMVDVWAYFSGGAVYAGNDKNKADFTGNNYSTRTPAANTTVWSLTGNAINSRNASTYNSPVPEGSCAKNYIIYISNGKNQENQSDNTKSEDFLKAAAGGGAAGTAAIAQISLGGNNMAANPIDEWARFMKKSSLAITTFAIEVDPGSQPADTDWTALMRSTAGSNYVAVRSGNGGADIVKAINDALSKIQSVNSVFAAVSLPASANVQGAYLNQLYVGMFRPDESSFPRWLGNLKQYKLGSATNLVDQDEHNAINTETGFVAECARSFWTPALPTAVAPDNYWSADPKGACIPPGGSDTLYANANSPDGNIVEKGAQGYRLRSGNPATRVVKTCSTSWAACTSMVDLDSTVATAAALGAATTAERDDLISFARGTNVVVRYDNSTSPPTPLGELDKPITERRPSIHGDVIHSNPLALSYGTDVIVYYGSNDGMLHAINGNRTANYVSTGAGSTTYLPGDELWAFLPPEFYPQIKRLRVNTDKVSVSPAGTDARTGSPKPYSIDGPISVYREAGNTSIYTSMRRGGRALYAFNVSTPAAPTLMWKSGCASAPATDCTAGAEGIGQTWSTARPTKIVDATNPVVLIMGGGYDDCEDPDVNTCTATSKGHNILVLDPVTGAVLKSLNTDRGVIADVRIVPDDSGKALYGYAADLGGNLYRINIGALAPASWTITKIASLGCASATTACTSNRKFMFAPSVIPELDGSYSLYLGSGDREKPLGSLYFPHNVQVSNYFFKVKDYPANSTWLTSQHETCGANVICLASLTSAGSVAGTCGASTPPLGAGYALALRPTEQVVTVAATRFGITTFSTHMPEAPVDGACTSKLGKVHVYNLDIATAQASSGTTCADEVTGGGLPPPPEKMDVCTNDACTTTKSVCIGCSAESPIQGDENTEPQSTLGSNAKRRVYWYIQK